MSAPGDVRHLVPTLQAPMPVPIPVHVAASQLLPVAEATTQVHYDNVGPPPPPPVQLHHVPSSPAAASVAVVVPDAYNSSSSGSSTCGGGGGYGAAGQLGVPPAPTRRMREFIPESKKDDEYWMKRHKNNEAAKRSREKRRANDAVMARRIHELVTENKRLKLELDVLRRQLGLIPPASDPQTPSAALSRLDVPPAQLPPSEQFTVRPKLEPIAVDYGEVADVTAPSDMPYCLTRGMMDPAGAEQKQRLEEPRYQYRHHHHVAYRAVPAGSDWPPACIASVSYSTSSTDARTFPSSQSNRSSTSGNFLPSIGNLCSGSAARADSGAAAAGRSASWTSYRPSTDDDDVPRCRALSLPTSTPRCVDSTPIVIFSDVSSSGDDSVDESLFGRNMDTLTVRQSDQPVDSVVVEAPLNLSTPSRQQSPVLASADSGLRRPSIDFAPVTAAWLVVRDEPERSRPDVSPHHGHRVLPTSHVYQRQTVPAGAREWSQESTSESADEIQRHLSSRSSSLSSVASGAWQSNVDVGPERLTAAPSADHVSPSARYVPCGLPLKVRRKLASASALRMVVDDVAEQTPDESAASTAPSTSQRWPDSRGSWRSSSTDSANYPVSTDWYRSTPTEIRQRASVTDYEALHPSDGPYQ